LCLHKPQPKPSPTFLNNSLFYPLNNLILNIILCFTYLSLTTLIYSILSVIPAGAIGFWHVIVWQIYILLIYVLHVLTTVDFLERTIKLLDSRVEVIILCFNKYRVSIEDKEDKGAREW